MQTYVINPIDYKNVLRDKWIKQFIEEDNLNQTNFHLFNHFVDNQDDIAWQIEIPFVVVYLMEIKDTIEDTWSNIGGIRVC